MWRSLAKHSVAVVVGVAVMVTTAMPALASFVRMTGGTQVVSTGTLAPPTDLAVTDGPCVKAKSVSNRLTWTPTASAFATGYEVLRDGAVIGTVAGAAGNTFVDTMADWSVAYSYAVRAVRNFWSSATTAAVSFTTAGKSCK